MKPTGGGSKNTQHHKSLHSKGWLSAGHYQYTYINPQFPQLLIFLIYWILFDPSFVFLDSILKNCSKGHNTRWSWSIAKVK